MSRRRGASRIALILDAIADTPWCDPFLCLPSDADEGASGYYDVIQRPVSIETIAQNLFAGHYGDVHPHGQQQASGRMFLKSDFGLIVTNCVQFNGIAHTLTAAACRLYDEFAVKMVFPLLEGDPPAALLDARGQLALLVREGNVDRLAEICLFCRNCNALAAFEHRGPVVRFHLDGLSDGQRLALTAYLTKPV